MSKEDTPVPVSTPDLRQRQRRKNRAVLLILLSLIAIIYAVTLAKLQGNVGA